MPIMLWLKRFTLPENHSDGSVNFKSSTLRQLSMTTLNRHKAGKAFQHEAENFLAGHFGSSEGGPRKKQTALSCLYFRKNQKHKMTILSSRRPAF